MVVDTSKPGWMVLHADCNNPCLDSGQIEGHSLWDKLKVPDVVRAPHALSLGDSSRTGHGKYSVLVSSLTPPSGKGY